MRDDSSISDHWGGRWGDHLGAIKHFLDIQYPFSYIFAQQTYNAYFFEQQILEYSRSISATVPEVQCQQKTLRNQCGILQHWLPTAPSKFSKRLDIFLNAANSLLGMGSYRFTDYMDGRINFSAAVFPMKGNYPHHHHHHHTQRVQADRKYISLQIHCL